jgi:tetratricopeptide (TPR) repeat protein
VRLLHVTSSGRLSSPPAEPEAYDNAGLRAVARGRLVWEDRPIDGLDSVTVDDRGAIAALVSDLHWQIDQMRPRGIKDAAGNPYNPSYYKRGLEAAIDRGGVAVADYLRRYLSKPPSDGYRKLEDANSLDLACEALIADAGKPYAHLFTDAERSAARARLAHHLDAIERRKAARERRIAARRLELPAQIGELRRLSAGATDDEEAVAINSAILALDARDVVSLIRLGRACAAIGKVREAKQTFLQVLEIDPTNSIADRRLRDLDCEHP